MGEETPVRSCTIGPAASFMSQRSNSSGASNLVRLGRIVRRLPEAERVDVEAWGDSPTFRVNGKNFIFCDPSGQHLTFKLSKQEAVAVVATDPQVTPAGYGLGRSGWVALTLEPLDDDDRWTQIEEWARTSYTLVAPRRLARVVLEQDGTTHD